MESEEEMSCAKKIMGRRKERKEFGATHTVINSHLAAASVREKYPASDCFEG
jgi:hypothetical protein